MCVRPTILPLLLLYNNNDTIVIILNNNNNNNNNDNNDNNNNMACPNSAMTFENLCQADDHVPHV